MPHSAVQMGTKKNPFKKVLNKLKNIHGSHPENGPLLPNKGQPKENPCLKKFKESLKFEVPIKNSIKLKNKVNLVCEPQDNFKSKEEQFRSLMNNNEYYNACLFIHDVEQTGKLDASELYDVVAQAMWKSLTLALDDDHNQTVSLQPLSECIQWVKQQRCNKGPEWSPGDWGNEIESLFENHIKKHNPKFDLKKGLNQCLVELHENISESLRRREQFPEILTAVYLKCLHNELFNHLKSLVNENLQYEDHVLLYKWAHKEHSRLCVHRVGSEDFDHLQYGNWFLDSGNKIASTGRNAMYKTLVEILQSEIVWNSYPKEKVPYYFSDVLEEGTKICKAVEDLGHSLVCRLQSLFWEEFLHFVTRYEAFLTEKLAGLITENGICIGIRIVKNCCILRNTIQNLGAEPQNLEIQGIRSLLGQCEKEGVDLILSSLKPSLKETFQNYFKNNCIEYENVLKNIKTMLIKEGIHNDQSLVTLIHHRLVVQFIQSFFKCAKKLFHQNAGEIFSNGSKKLLNVFVDMVADDLLPNSPLDFITEILTANDTKSLHTTTVFFIDKHQDLREEHLKLILNIKGNLSRTEKEDLLYYIRNRKMDCNQNKLCFFEGIQVDNSKFNYLLCCLG